jgi:hypothetical protein
MTKIKSQRAQKLLEKPQALVDRPLPLMRKYPNEAWKIQVLLEREGPNVKKLSYHGSLADHEKVLIEALSQIITERPLALLEKLSFRECEAYLRDKNSENALEEVSEDDERNLKKFMSWLRTFPEANEAQDYEFSSIKGPFRSLKLVDKIRELKAFLNSTEILALYQNSVRPELVDVDELTVYIYAPYQSDEDRARFEELHLRGVSAFQEESLNFIPEA